jgi:hypothetical protein
MELGFCYFILLAVMVATIIYLLNLPQKVSMENNIETYEFGKLTIEEYLSRVVFNEERSFTLAQFQRFMCAQSKPYPEMIELIRRLKVRYGRKIILSKQGPIVPYVTLRPAKRCRMPRRKL